MQSILHTNPKPIPDSKSNPDPYPKPNTHPYPKFDTVTEIRQKSQFWGASIIQVNPVGINENRVIKSLVSTDDSELILALNTK